MDFNTSRNFYNVWFGLNSDLKLLATKDTNGKVNHVIVKEDIEDNKTEAEPV